MESKFVSALAATKPPRRGIEHSNSYLRASMPQLHAELVKLGCEVEWTGLTNIVADNEIYRAWNEIYRAAHGHGFAPEPEAAARPASVPAAASGPAQVAAYLESLPKPGAAATAPKTAPAVISDAKLREISVAVFGESKTAETLREVPFKHGQDTVLARRDALLKNFAMAGLKIPGAAHSYLTTGGGHPSAVRRAAAVKAQAIVNSLLP